jgi:pimeloyl-ACP methyl ester carboxylesterase
MTDWPVKEEFATEGGVVRWAAVGSGKPMVLLHGTPFSSFIWRDIALALANTRRIYVWDMLGFGHSDKCEGQDVSLAVQGQILSALLRHWNLVRPSVVAHDVGGVVALRAAIIEGATFRDLTLVNAVGVPDWSNGAFFRTVKADPGLFARLPKGTHEAIVASKIQDASHLGLRPAVLDALIDPWRGVDGQAAFYRQYGQADEAHSDEFQNLLGTLSIPTRILWGREDRWLSPQYAERLRTRIPGAEFAWIEQAGHLVQEDAPAQLLAHLCRKVAPGLA